MTDKGGKFGTGPRNTTGTGLRDRKKTRRREDILNAAQLLFAENGIDNTTVAEIAAAVQISPPTVFNYFGNKDGILIALITEGTTRAREAHRGMAPFLGADFATLLTRIFTDVSRRTLDIAGKRVWRYAEAAMIRHPTTDLARQYQLVDVELYHTLSLQVGRYDMRLRGGTPADPSIVAQVFFDLWNPTFFRLICDDARSLDQHRSDIDARFRPVAQMLFDPDFLRSPALKSNGPPPMQDLT